MNICLTRKRDALLPLATRREATATALPKGLIQARNAPISGNVILLLLAFCLLTFYTQSEALSTRDKNITLLSEKAKIAEENQKKLAIVLRHLIDDLESYKAHVSPFTDQTIKEESSLPSLLATVKVVKANLRMGPSFEQGVLMSVSKDSRLVVEHSASDWHRVITPNGERAWIHASVVTLGSNTW